MITVRPNSNKLEPWFREVYFQYDFQKKEIVKAIPGARWDNIKKCWIVPEGAIESIKRLFKEVEQ